MKGFWESFKKIVYANDVWLICVGFFVLLTIIFAVLWIRSLLTLSRERILRHQLTQERDFIKQSIQDQASQRQEIKALFQSLSLEALGQNNRLFLDLAESNLQKLQESLLQSLEAKEKSVGSMVSPIQERLGKMDETLRGLEKERVGSYEALKTQVQKLLESQHHLQAETATLAKALRTPHIRGRWGEIQLRRLVEMSGLSAHCDFSEQVTTHGDEGRFRPDMVLNLPQGKRLVLDAKAPLNHYLEAMDCSDETQQQHFLSKHAQNIRTHVTFLSGKSYWTQFPKDDVPEFVVLFLPGDTFFNAALSKDPGLIEWSLEKRVILSTPATLLALLHAIAYGWRQEKLSDQILELSKVGQELAKRLGDVLGHVNKVGSDIGGAVKSYNRLVGSIETRLMPGARRFRDLSGHREGIETPESLDQIPKNIAS